MSKYYTPQIEEFHIGFECEFKNKMQSNEWEKERCNTDTLSIAFDSWEHGTKEFDDDFEDSFRVKYLDKEDIESLGFVYQHTQEKVSGWVIHKEGEYKCEYFIDRSAHESKKLGEGKRTEEYSNIWSNRKMFDIEYYPDIHLVRLFNWSENERNFEGIIKNKSELKKLLQQLNINYE